jgi:hypothetical protein
MKEAQEDQARKAARNQALFRDVNDASRNWSGRRGTRSSYASVPTSTAWRHWSFR